jgi:type VI protein secretion system component Hcp
MSIEVFAVIPRSASAGSASIVAPPTTDAYFRATFPNAAVIGVQDYALSMESATTIGTSGTGTSIGKMQFGELTIRKPVDQSSPSLFTAAASGAHLPVVQLYVRAVGAKGVPYLGYEFQIVYLTKIDWNGDSGGDQAGETLHLIYGGVVTAFQATNADGTVAPAVRGSWSQVTNKGGLTDTIPLK